MTLEAHAEAVANRTTQLVNRLALGLDIEGKHLTIKRRQELTAELRLLGVKDIPYQVAQRLSELTKGIPDIIII